MYGGRNDAPLSSVEMLSLDDDSWKSLPTPMFAADESFASVPLPVYYLTITTTTEMYHNGDYDDNYAQTMITIIGVTVTIVIVACLIFGCASAHYYHWTKHAQIDRRIIQRLK